MGESEVDGDEAGEGGGVLGEVREEVEGGGCGEGFGEGEKGEEE